MASNLKPIPAAEPDLRRLLDEAANGQVLVERNGECFRLVRDDHAIAYEPDAELVRENLAATLGRWSDVDAGWITVELLSRKSAAQT